jgi:hypothetical protein
MPKPNIEHSQSDFQNKLDRNPEVGAPPNPGHLDRKRAYPSGLTAEWHWLTSGPKSNQMGEIGVTEILVVGWHVALP